MSEDPYMTPETVEEVAPRILPKVIKVVCALLGLSFIFSAAETVLFLRVGGADLADPSNYIFIAVWAAIVWWIFSGIRSAKYNPKYTMLILICIVLGMNLFDNQGNAMWAVNSMEAACYLVMFFLLSTKDAQQWFSNREVV